MGPHVDLVPAAISVEHHRLVAAGAPQREPEQGQRRGRRELLAGGDIEQADQADALPALFQDHAEVAGGACGPRVG